MAFQTTEYFGPDPLVPQVLCPGEGACACCPSRQRGSLSVDSALGLVFPFPTRRVHNQSRGLQTITLALGHTESCGGTSTVLASSTPGETLGSLVQPPVPNQGQAGFSMGRLLSLLGRRWLLSKHEEARAALQ